MKKIILSLILSISLLNANLFQERDKKLHMLVTAQIGVFATLIAKENGFTYNESFWIGVGSSVFIGLLKEVYDSRKGGTGFDSRDMLANTIGGVGGSTLMVGTHKVLTYEYKF